MTEADDVDTAVDRRERTETDEGRDYFDAIGPWATEELVSKTLKLTVSELQEAIALHQVLAVEFGTDRFYPAVQIQDGLVLPGLERVLTVLSPGFTSATSQAGWLAEPAWEGRRETRWDVLLSGKVDLVVRWADEDAARVTGT